MQTERSLGDLVFIHRRVGGWASLVQRTSKLVSALIGWLGHVSHQKYFVALPGWPGAIANVMDLGAIAFVEFETLYSLISCDAKQGNTQFVSLLIAALWNVAIMIFLVLFDWILLYF